MTTLLFALSLLQGPRVPGANPAIVDAFTADPAALVHKGRVYLYAGHDEANEGQGYTMREWLVYSSGDMKSWTSHGSPLSVKDFAWARADAWASQAIERNGKFYWYVAVEHREGGKAIGVAVGDSPTGPFRDARGSALVTNGMTRATDISWDDIDPTVIVDGEDQAWLVWGNRKCYRAKLKPNMTELDGPIETIELPAFEEAPYLHRRKGTYYLSYATGFPERTAYATAPRVQGPWTPRGLLGEGAANCNTAHQAIIEFKGRWYYIYHNGMSPRSGGSFRRSVCVDRLEYNRDGSIRRVLQTSEGLSR